MPNTMVAFHCAGVSRQVWPNIRAIAIPTMPEIKNRKDSAKIGGASVTMIRADVKADDQISANANPANIARISIV
jgi:hypothetical protein